MEKKPRTKYRYSKCYSRLCCVLFSTYKSKLIEHDVRFSDVSLSIFRFSLPLFPVDRTHLPCFQSSVASSLQCSAVVIINKCMHLYLPLVCKFIVDTI